jgi:hypothetical protein
MLLQFSFPAFGEGPGLWNSQRFLGADQIPLPHSGTGSDWGLTFLVGGRGLATPDEIARWVCPLPLGVQLGQDYSEGWNSGAKEDLECHQVACYLIWSRVPLYSGAVQPLADGSRGQNGWYLAGTSWNVVEILSDEKPSDTQRSGELRLYFVPAVPYKLTLKILGAQ